ncbi:MAG: HisA/HisF-related TIM barrel protein [Rubripirellula sp.]
MTRFADDLFANLVGVVDLQNGQAVHAIAGNRSHYQPVAFCDGDPQKLVDHYRRVGVGGIYLADLDGLSGGSTQSDVIESICERVERLPVLVDTGWSPSLNASAIADLADRFCKTRWIAATESLTSIESLREFAKLVGPQRTLLGLDFRDGELVSQGVGSDEWLSAACDLSLDGVLVLDVADVGTGRGPSTAKICHEIRRAMPELRIVSGGGVRDSDDVRALLDAGCESCLAATALLP